MHHPAYRPSNQYHIIGSLIWSASLTVSSEFLSQFFYFEERWQTMFAIFLKVYTNFTTLKWIKNLKWKQSSCFSSNSHYFYYSNFIDVQGKNEVLLCNCFLTLFRLKQTKTVLNKTTEWDFILKMNNLVKLYRFLSFVVTSLFLLVKSKSTLSLKTYPSLLTPSHVILNQILNTILFYS